jgi:aminoglycoside phosphotransferase (APT) family kinase protein
VPAHRGPAAGLHSFHRGCHPGVYEDQVEEALRALGDAVDADTCRAIWREAMTSTWAGPAVWFHGDVAAGNLLTASGRLCAVIDFGTCGVGDPACDLVIAWTFLGPEQREVFRDAAGLPDDAWARARGWALWKALIGMVDGAGSWHDTHARTLGQLMAEASTGRATTT